MSSIKNPKVFKTALRGYSKESVNEYIATVDAERAEEAASLKEEIENSRAAASQALEALESAKKEAAKAQAQAETAQKSAEESLKKLQEAQNEAIKAKEALAELQKKLQETDELYESARAEADQLKDQLAKTEKKSTDNSEKATAVLNDAMSVSEGLIASARREASEIKRLADVELELARDAVRKSAGDAMRDINKMIDDAAQEVAKELASTVQEAEDVSNKLNGELASKSHRLATRVAHIRSVLEADVESRISEIAIDKSAMSRTNEEPKNEPATKSSPRPAGKAKNVRSQPSNRTSQKGFDLSSVFKFKK